MCKSISIVIPTLNSAQHLVATLDHLLMNLEAARLEHEIIIIDDSSSDTTWSLVIELAKSNSKIRGFQLTDNYGQAVATLIGVLLSRFSKVLTMDDDLEHPPELIRSLVQLSEETGQPIYGVPSSRRNLSLRNAHSRLLRSVLSFFTGSKNWKQQSSFRLITAPSAEYREQFQRDLSLDFLIHHLLGDSTAVEYQSSENLNSNKSRYKLRDLFRHAWRQLRGSSSLLSLASWASSVLSALVALTSILSLVVALFLGKDSFNLVLAAVFSLIAAFAFGALARKSQTSVYRKAKPLTYEIGARTDSTVPS